MGEGAKNNKEVKNDLPFFVYLIAIVYMILSFIGLLIGIGGIIAGEGIWIFIGSIVGILLGKGLWNGNESSRLFLIGICILVTLYYSGLIIYSGFSYESFSILLFHLAIGSYLLFNKNVKKSFMSQQNNKS